MTILSEIGKLVDRLDGVDVCDRCITDKLNLSVSSQANAVTRAMADARRYERKRDACGFCGASKIVIRRMK